MDLFYKMLTCITIAIVNKFFQKVYCYNARMAEFYKKLILLMCRGGGCYANMSHFVRSV